MATRSSHLTWYTDMQWKARMSLVLCAFFGVFSMAQSSSISIVNEGAHDEFSTFTEPWRVDSAQQRAEIVGDLPGAINGYEVVSTTSEQKPSFSFEPLHELRDALETMQSEFFEVWLGYWPTTIDWTGAVIGTYVSSTLSTLSQTYSYHMYSNDPRDSGNIVQEHLFENYLNRFFSQISAYYYAENAFSIRQEAYDDMLWVVLGWLESIKLMNKHNDLHYRTSLVDFNIDNPTWHGKQFEAAFAHRSHIFHDIAQHGWDDKLCGGGLTWNPRLKPYKNTITNTLFISASIGMYLYHPGDQNSSPYLYDSSSKSSQGLPETPAHQPKYLQFAIDGYDWLKSINLTNSQGLYVDGYHIRDWGRNGSRGTSQCDERNEMVYSYNQGVLLSGLRGLWEGTGNLAYLEDGHKLVRNVISATGWTREFISPNDRSSILEETMEWGGIGRSGILQEFCDASATCSQDAQTFKGIFFNHLVQFCEPLPTENALIPGHTFVAGPNEALMHARSCKGYTSWIAHNAMAAVSTKNAKGVFGMWWAADESISSVELPPGAVDIMNEPWILNESEIWNERTAVHSSKTKTKPDTSFHLIGRNSASSMSTQQESITREEWDNNDRGRGRTVETQGGGLMVVRALLEFLNLYGA